MKAATGKLILMHDGEKVFQSTPPVKAATGEHMADRTDTIFQSTPPVKAATGAVVDNIAPVLISIHAAREGGDLPAFGCRRRRRDFNPRRP